MTIQTKKSIINKGEINQSHSSLLKTKENFLNIFH